MTALVLRGDARRLPLPDGSVDLVVTSPPYYALRSYQDGGEHYAGQIGSERTPQAYLEALWECTAEWARVLKPDGSIFVDLGDKYSDRANGGPIVAESSRADRAKVRPPQVSTTASAPAKSLLLLPERYRIGCVDRLGLIARAVIVWQKPNGMPESVTDRVRRSHEDWVHLVKQPHYYAAVDEIRESHAASTFERKAIGQVRTSVGDPSGHDRQHNMRGTVRDVNPLGKLPGSVWAIPSEPLRTPDDLPSHFAAFPSEWPRRLILGWSRSGICTACGEGRRPVADRTPMRWRPSPTLNGRSAPGTSRRPASGTMLAPAETRITGYACACTPYTDHPGGVGMLPRTGPWREYHLDRWTPAPTRPAVVLDPFAGTGTTMLVASVLGRVGVGTELSADYCRLARWRTTDPGERARAMRVPKLEPVAEAQLDLFGGAL